MENCIAATERAIGNVFPECPVYRAFLSNVVRKRLLTKYQLAIDTVEEALERILQDGYQKVVVQPTLILGGIEYDLLVGKLQAEKRLQIVTGRALLETEEDCQVLADVIMEENPLKEQETLMLMGHGTDHAANEVYLKLQDIFAERNYSCFIGTVEGIPSFEDAVEKLVAGQASKAKLLPLMFVAGDHAKNDMAGEEDSLYSMVRDAGVAAEVIIRGLGESERIRKIYGERALEAFGRLL